MIPLVIIAGPTASGKTALSVELAKRLDGEIVSADSMQIYKYMDIGTAKPTAAERRGIPHHMMDIILPTEDFSVADYSSMAHKVIADIHSRGKLPIMVGGTGLYIDTVADNIVLGEAVGDEKIRAQLEEFAETNGNTALHKLLEEIDPESYENLHENDVKRVIRAIEIYRVTGKTIGEHNRRSRTAPKIYKTVKLAVAWDRNVLYERINRRVDEMIESGLEKEVRACLELGVTEKNTSMQAIGYKEMLGFIKGVCTLEEAVDKIKMESRRYAKRQLSWFKRGNIYWLAPRDDIADRAQDVIRGELL